MDRALTLTEQAVLDRVDMPHLFGLLDRLVRVASHDGRETPAQDVVEAALRDADLEVDRWNIDLPQLRQHPAYSEEIDRREAVGLVGELQGSGAGPTLILNGHVDVVTAGDLDSWTVPPWETTHQDGRIYGRGAVDMKGGLCCAIAAIQAIQSAGVQLAGRVALQSVIGEEDGGLGTLACLERGHTGDGAVVMEPTRLRIITLQAGALNFRLRIAGRSAHGCVREEGVSALEKLWPVHQALLELEADRNRRCEFPELAGYRLPYPLSIGCVRGGDWPSSVPEWLEIEGRYGVMPGETVPAARAQLELAVTRATATDRWLAENPPQVEWWGGRFEPARTDRNSGIVRALAQCLPDATGRETVLEGVPYGSDMRLLVNEGGVPTVLFGPGDVRQAHGPDEFVPAEELEQATRTLTLLILRFCGVAA